MQFARNALLRLCRVVAKAPPASTRVPVPFNVNDMVRVRLTADGRNWHAQDHIDFWQRVGRPPPYEYRAPKEDEQGWSEWQLWHLMEMFGPRINLAGPVPFGTEIQVLALRTNLTE